MRLILKWTLNICFYEDLKWIESVQDRVQLRSYVILGYLKGREKYSTTRWIRMRVCVYVYIYIYTLGVPGGKVNILRGHSVGHSKKKLVCVHVSYSERFPRWSYFTVQQFGFSAQYYHSLPLYCATVWSMWIGVKRQLAVATADSDIVGVLWKLPHIFTNAEYDDMLYAVLTRDAKCIDVDGGIFQNILY
jgi:hypothetical protein